MAKELRAVLVPKFQKELLTNVIDRNGIKFLMKELSTNHSLIYHYRNNRINSFTFSNLKKIVNLSSYDTREVEKHIISVYDSEEKTKGLLNFGRNIRLNKIKKIKENLPKVSELVSDNKINFEKWFVEYVKLSFSGVREIKSIKSENDTLVVKYSNFSKGVKKDFLQVFPKYFILDDDFQYFLGLWTGDRIGKGRFGVGNNNEKINLETDRILKKYFQKTIFDLNIHIDLPLPKINLEINKIYRNKSKSNIKGYCVWVYSQNATLFRFFDYLISDLDFMLAILPNKNIFFAGLFDAEGNVNLDDYCLKWACCNKAQIEIYKKHLSELNLFERYDGSCLITKNIDSFKDLVWPYVKHSQKVNDLSLLFDLGGVIPQRLKNVLFFIHLEPGITQKELAKGLKKAKIYSQVKFLEKKGYLMVKGYPHQFYLTEKGNEELWR